MSRNDESQRHLRKLDLVHGEDDSRDVRRSCTVVFLHGACGDITQVNNLNPYQQPGAEELARLVGGRVGAEAIKALLSSPRGALAPVPYSSKQLRIAASA